MIKTIVDINNLNLQNYYTLWEEFWFFKLGYHPNKLEKQEVNRRLSKQDVRTKF